MDSKDTQGLDVTGPGNRLAESRGGYRRRRRKDDTSASGRNNHMMVVEFTKKCRW